MAKGDERMYRTDRQQTARAPLTPDRVVEVALAMARREGLDALRMRSLADELGVTAMAIYHHVASKDELLMLVAEAATADLSFPSEPADWVARLRAYALVTRRRYLTYPGLAGLVLTAGPPVTRARGVEAAVSGLVELGIPPAEATRLFTVVALWVLGAIHAETMALPPRPPDATDPVRSLSADALLSLPPEEFPTLAAARPVFEGVDPDAQFTYGLDLLLDGVRAEVDRLRTAATSQAPTASA